MIVNHLHDYEKKDWVVKGDMSFDPEFVSGYVTKTLKLYAKGKWIFVKPFVQQQDESVWFEHRGHLPSGAVIYNYGDRMVSKISMSENGR